MSQDKNEFHDCLRGSTASYFSPINSINQEPIFTMSLKLKATCDLFWYVSSEKKKVLLIKKQLARFCFLLLVSLTTNLNWKQVSFFVPQGRCFNRTNFSFYILCGHKCQPWTPKHSLRFSTFTNILLEEFILVL